MKKCFAFNVWSIDSAKAVIDAAVEKDRNIFLQVSSKVFKKIDTQEFIESVKSYIKKKNANVIVHLDHSKDIQEILKAIEIGWDAVMFDGSDLSLKENIRLTKKVVAAANKKSILVEAELGKIKGVEDDIEADAETTVRLQEISEFLQEVKVDLLAVAIGTAHGQYKAKEPTINHKLINDIKKLTMTPFVVHGGSELSDEILKELFIHSNVKKINISTDIKQAYRKGIVEATNRGLLEESGFDATKVEDCIYNMIKNVVKEKLNILECIDNE